MNKINRNSWQQGFMGISLAVVMAGIISTGTLLYDKITHHNPPGVAAPITQPVSAKPPTSISTTFTNKTNIPIKNTASTSSSSEKDCGTDVNCFIANVASCSPTKGKIIVTANNVFGVDESVTSEFQILGKNTNGMCNFIYTHTAFKLAPNVNNTGLTLADLKSAQDDLNKYVGIKTKCTDSISNLTKIFTTYANLKGNVDTSNINISGNSNTDINACPDASLIGNTN
ncbi:MAG: hypothetical protein JWM92_156 [Candidatus Nomurabacteria bacterium]|nr:hypothetical protein [Candidatus Nomurabacteria bacterium]